MKFIPGFVFKVGQGSNKPKIGGSLLEMAQSAKNTPNDPLFIKGITYKIYTIMKVEDGFNYIFQDQNNKLIPIKFKDQTEADNRILTLIG
jgi:hypothetical protein